MDSKYSWDYFAAVVFDEVKIFQIYFAALDYLVNPLFLSLYSSH